MSLKFVRFEFNKIQLASFEIGVDITLEKDERLAKTMAKTLLEDDVIDYVFANAPDITFSEFPPIKHAANAIFSFRRKFIVK